MYSFLCVCVLCVCMCVYLFLCSIVNMCVNWWFYLSLYVCLIIFNLFFFVVCKVIYINICVCMSLYKWVLVYVYLCVCVFLSTFISIILFNYVSVYNVYVKVCMLFYEFVYLSACVIGWVWLHFYDYYCFSCVFTCSKRFEWV